MKVFNWLKESNRLLHLKAGFMIWVILTMLSIGCLVFFDSLSDITQPQVMAIAITCSIISVAAVFISMCSVEYIQKQSGGKWDWLDILARCLLPVFITLILVAFAFLL